MKLKREIFAMIVSTIGLIAAASAQHSDVEIVVESGTLVVEERVVEGEFGEAPNPANVADEPGLEVDDGIFNVGETLSFDVSDILGKHLWFWDGSDVNNVAFQDSAHDLTIEHPLTAATTALSSSTGGGASGFLVGAADSDGGIHQDLEFVLDTPSPTSGVYLFGLEMTSDTYASSDTVYFVLASGVDEMVHEAAVDWVTDTFTVPESHGLALLWIAPLFWMMRRTS
jgi:hypothetical protein